MVVRVPCVRGATATKTELETESVLTESSSETRTELETECFVFSPHTNEADCASAAESIAGGVLAHPSGLVGLHVEDAEEGAHLRTRLQCS